MIEKPTDGIFETLEAMLQQESNYYSSSEHVNVNHSASHINQVIGALESIHELCRMLHHDTLMIAANYLHRYLQATSLDESLGRVALVCLYMACKIHEPAALPVRTLTDLYQRFLSNHDEDEAEGISSSWEQLELNVCSALRWRLHPPTAMAFCDQFLLPAMEERRRLRKRAHACLEAAFIRNPSSFFDHRASALATAALILAERDTTHFADAAAAASGKETSCPLGMALAFLKENTNGRSNSSSSSCPSSPAKKNRKRCVTPTLPDERSRKRSKHTLSPCCRISASSAGLLSTPPAPPCLLWTGSPRSAFSMTE